MAMAEGEADAKPEVVNADVLVPVSASHPFSRNLNQLLDERRFDEVVERMCEPSYAETLGRPGLAPGIYFHLLMVGYFEGIDSERGIGCCAREILSIRLFVLCSIVRRDTGEQYHNFLTRLAKESGIQTPT